MKLRSSQQVFRDPICGYVHVDYQMITDLINTKAFQRLRRIRQLAGVSMVFHAAEHSRFSHSLGVYELSNRFLKLPHMKEHFNERERLLLMCAALLHDLGHGPYSHAFETIFDVDHEQLSAKIILKNKEIVNILNTIDDDFKEDVTSIILKKGKYTLHESLISSQLDLDRLDYLERDAYFTGAAYGHVDIDRLLRVMQIVDNKVVYRQSGIHAIENYLVARYHMYWQVYYHPKSRAYEVILEKIYERIKTLIEKDYNFNTNITFLKNIMNNKEDLESYLRVDDYYINGMIMQLTDSDDDILRCLCSDFMNRRMWTYLDVNDNNLDKIKEIKSKMSSEELKYFSLETTVHQVAYIESTKTIDNEINILTDNKKIIPLSQYSPIIHSLITTAEKSDPKFFYRIKDE